jgi:hypothetical protein
MKRRWLTLAAGVVLAATAGGALAAASASKRAPNCRTDRFEIAKGRELGHPTGSRMLSLVLRNHGPAPCVLNGYPQLALFDRRGPLPFVISHSGDQVVTQARPKRVVVRVGGAAVVLADKYRCDGGDRRTPRTVRLAFGRATGAPLTLELRRPPYGDDLAYCGPGDPGSILTVSPFEPSLRAAARYW